MAMLFRQFTPKACIEYNRLFHQAAGQDAYLHGIAWTIRSLCIPSPQHMYTPRKSVTKLRPFVMPSSIQLKIDSSNRITPFVSIVPFAVTAPFALTTPFGTLASSWPENAHHSHPPWPTTKTNCFQQCHPRCLRHRNLQAVQRREVHSHRLPVCPLVLDTWLPWVTPGQRVSPNELSWAQTPLRHAQFERELAGYPDKSWVSKLLTAVK